MAPQSAPLPLLGEVPEDDLVIAVARRRQEAAIGRERHGIGGDDPIPNGRPAPPAPTWYSQTSRSGPVTASDRPSGANARATA